MKQLCSVLLVAFCAFSIRQTPAHAENWPRFRGPTGQGLSTEKGLPLHWSASSNVLWQTAVPGEGWSSPIIWANQVFLTTTTDKGVHCHVLSFAKSTGQLLWDKEVFDQQPSLKESKNSYATPTPCTDGERVYCVFGDGSILAMRFDGTVAWTNREVQFYSRHGLGASPIICNGLLIMPYDGSNKVGEPGKYPNNTPEERLGWQIPWDQSFIAALDLKTGRRVWTGKRGMSRIAHITPNILVEKGQQQIISCAGDAIQGFDPKTGECIWTIYSQGEGVVPSFALGDGLIFTSSGFEKSTLRAVRTGGLGEVTKTHIAWEQRKGVPTQASLLYVKPYLYSVTDGGIANCFKAESGDIVYQERLGGTFSASPVYADGKIYFLSESGETTVVEAGPEFEIISKSALNEKCQASMAISDGHIFIRTEKSLFCLGK